MAGESRHQWVVDSVEEGVAAIEIDGTRVVSVPVSLLPLGVREGDVFRVLHIRDEIRSGFTIERDDGARDALRERSGKQVSEPVSEGSGDVRL
jgi:hypothetical protein